MSSNDFKLVDGKQVEKILEQGQKLRNSMLCTILKNDPFTDEILPHKLYNTPVGSLNDVLINQNVEHPKSLNANPIKQKLIEAYLKGDYLSKEQERTALETLKSMSGVELSYATEQTFFSQESTARNPTCSIPNKERAAVKVAVENHLCKSCFCYTCKAYSGSNLDCDLRRPQFPNNLKPNLDLDKAPNCQHFEILKYADSLKITLHNISLNDLGNKKTLGVEKPGTNETYFIEYHLPNSLLESSRSRNKSKVDSGLDNSSVRICSRRSGQSINFNHTFTHDIANLQDSTLAGAEIVFRISYRSQKQKFSQILGFAKWKLDSFSVAKNLTCSKALAIHFKNEDCPIIVGTLKVTTQLGCGRLYFGKDFVEAINCEQNSETLDSESSNLEIEKPPRTKIPEKESKNKEVLIVERPNVSKSKEVLLQKSILSQEINSRKINTQLQRERPALSKYQANKASGYFISQDKENSEHLESQRTTNQETEQKQLLFGFIYVSEAQFLNHCPSSYIGCQPFCQSETSNSRLVTNSTNPLYNFCQKVPLLYDNDLLLKLRENLTLVEFWERQDQTDSLFGITKLPLHQFYLAYRNGVILQHLTKNKLPIIGTDWWEPIYSIENEELIGQVQVLTALGTEEQIENLESERGFKNDLVRAKYLKPYVSKFEIDNSCDSNSWRDRVKVNKKTEILTERSYFNFLTKNCAPNDELSLKLPKNTSNFNLTSQTKVTSLKPEKVDVGVQSDSHLNNMASSNKGDIHSQDMISSFLKILDQQRQQRPVVTESSTNTECIVVESNPSSNLEDKDLVNSNVRKTSDLLDTLQKALSLDTNLPNVPKINPNVFKAHISIKNANHLPSKKKLKAKKSKNKGKSQEENILPSTYVTLETLPNDPIKITNVVPKSTSPQWNYECDVDLPTELLINSQKRLIFKVWKKSNNVVLQPNMQTDTVLGFAAADLSVLAAGLPNVQGWFNIVDFSGTCNGQINIHITPIDNLNRFRKKPKPVQASTSDVPHTGEPEDGSDLLGRTLKRKFTELDEITQRLRLRLSEVVDEESENDENADEFERDINSLCIEEDFDMANFEQDTQSNVKTKSNMKDLLTIQSQPGSSKEPSIIRLTNLESTNGSSASIRPTLESVSSASLPTDRHLAEGKQRIDTLLEKLSLISAGNAQAFSSRYVSGCSVSNQELDIDTEHLLQDLDKASRPNITESNLNRFKELYGETLASQSEISTDNNTDNNLLKASGSASSESSNFSDCRPNPDGQGNQSDEKSES